MGCAPAMAASSSGRSSPSVAEYSHVEPMAKADDACETLASHISAEACSAEDFWQKIRLSGMDRRYRHVRRLMLGLPLPGHIAENIVGFCVREMPNILDKMWTDIYPRFDHSQPGVVQCHFSVYVERVKKEVCRCFPDVAWEGAESCPQFAQYKSSSPLRFCRAILFYRVDHHVHAGFVADLMGQLANGIYFYYREGPPSIGCGGLSRCTTYVVLATKSLCGLVEQMSSEDRFDIATGRRKPRPMDCECQRFRWECRRPFVGPARADHLPPAAFSLTI